MRLGCVLLLAAGFLCPIASLAEAQSSSRGSRGKQQVEEVRQSDIDRDGVLILVRGTLIALDQANKTGNYTVFRDLAASEFRVNDAAKLAEIFARQRSDEIDLGGTLVLEPQLTIMPQINKDGDLHLKGFFPSAPTQVNFDLFFAPQDEQWKIVSILINFTKGGTPIAPVTEQKPKTRTPSKPPVSPTASIDSH